MICAATPKKNPQPNQQIRQERYQAGKRRPRQGCRARRGRPTRQSYPHCLFHLCCFRIQFGSDLQFVHRSSSQATHGVKEGEWWKEFNNLRYTEIGNKIAWQF